MSGHLPTSSFSTLGLLAVGLLLLPGLGACSTLPSDGPCMPPPFSLSPAAATPGSEITVSAPAATCNPRYGENARIVIDLYDAADQPLLSATAPMDDDGAFSYTLTLPQEMIPGEASVTAMPDGVDWCDDTGQNNRVNAQDEIVRTSCAIPSQILVISPADN